MCFDRNINGNRGVKFLGVWLSACAAVSENHFSIKIKASRDIISGWFCPCFLSWRKSPHLLGLTEITYRHVSVIPHGYPWPLGSPDLPSSKSKIGWLQIPGNEHWGHGSIWQSMSLCRLFWMIVMQNFVKLNRNDCFAMSVFCILHYCLFWTKIAKVSSMKNNSDVRFWFNFKIMHDYPPK